MFVATVVATPIFVVVVDMYMYMYSCNCCSGGSNRCTYLACTSSLGNGANHPGRLPNGGGGRSYVTGLESSSYALGGMPRGPTGPEPEPESLPLTS